MADYHSRIRELAEKAAPLLTCGHLTNRPNPLQHGERIVGFVIGEDEIGSGLSEPLFALEALVELANIADRFPPVPNSSHRRSWSRSYTRATGMGGVGQEGSVMLTNSRGASELLGFRVGLGLTQEGMARLLGVDRAHLSRLERGERNLTGEQTIRFNLLRSLARDAILRERMKEVANVR